MEVQLERQNEAFHFVGTGETPVEINIDGAPNIGGDNKGARPMELLLMGLAGCSAIDIGLILKKQRQVIDSFKIKVNAQRSDAVPSLFTKIDVDFQIEGNIDESKLKRAVSLSMDKYCSVSKILEKTAEISYHITNRDKIIEFT